MPSEKELDLAFDQAIQSNPEFLSWFLESIGLGEEEQKLIFLRSNHPWCKFRVVLPNPETGALEAFEREGETDILAVFESASARKVGVHIENKIESGSFTPEQPELYAARAEHWVGAESYGSYDTWVTVLVAPASFMAKFSDQCRKFTFQLCHEDIAVYVSEFGGNE